MAVSSLTMAMCMAVGKVSLENWHEVEAKEQLDIFLDAGGTLLDTAASYSRG